MELVCLWQFFPLRKSATVVIYGVEGRKAATEGHARAWFINPVLDSAVEGGVVYELCFSLTTTTTKLMLPYPCKLHGKLPQFAAAYS